MMCFDERAGPAFLESVYAPEVMVQMETSFSGGAIEKLKMEAWATRLKTFRDQFDMTQHIVR
jgi:hypothetical protein